jgi:hypothetical protein
MPDSTGLRLHAGTERDRIAILPVVHHIPYDGTNQIRFEGLAVTGPPLNSSLPLRWTNYALV